MTLAPDGSALYVVESTPPKISRVAIHPDGSAGEISVVVELPRTVPDGVAFDMAGNLYITLYVPDRIYRLTPSGALEVVADDWERLILNAPTNIAFGGADMRTLLIASLGGNKSG